MKITVDYDTVTKKMSVTKDGEVVEKLQSICFYHYGDDDDSDSSMEMRQAIYEWKEKGIYTNISTMAQLLFPGENLDEN